MKLKKGRSLGLLGVGGMVFMFLITLSGIGFGSDLSEIKQRGVLRHLGVPYANFVTGSGDGMDVELSRRFADYLGVKYEYVGTSWKDVIGDLTGKLVKSKGDEIEMVGEVPVKGDLIANGFTILEWRKKIVDFATEIFPTQVWVMARADSPMKPIVPSGDIDKDIAAVKAQLKGRSLLGMVNTCLDPDLYCILETGAGVKLFKGRVISFLDKNINISYNYA